MRIARLQNGEDVDGLVRRLYSGIENKTQARRVATELRAANPALRRVAKVPRGARIVVPDIPGTERAGRAQPIAAASAAVLLGAVRDRASALARELLDSAEVQVEIAAEQAQILADPKLAAALDHAELKAVAGTLKERAAEEREAASELKASCAALDAALAAHVDGLTKLVKRGS